MRTAKDTNETITAELQTVIDAKLDNRLSESEIKEIAYRWSTKDYQHHKTLAAQLNLKPSALLLFALLFTEHQLLVAPGRGIKYHFLQCKAVILMAELQEQDVEIPFIPSTAQEKTFYPQPVSRLNRIENQEGVT